VSRQSLLSQISRLPLDKELRRLAEEGANNLSDTEVETMAIELESALDGLPVVVQRLSDTRSGATRHLNIGKSVVIKGELNGSEDLTIEGHVEGTIQLRDHVLTIGPNGRIKAQVFAKAVIVLGKVTGNITARDKVDIRDNGSVDGDIVSPRVAIAEGAHFRGTVDMQRKGGPTRAQSVDKKAQAREEEATLAYRPSVEREIHQRR
jgi:cytoskeletal protein CcmA (bactofilin family)